VTPLSVFTPSHTARYLDDCYASLLEQTRTHWEWIVLLNDGAPDWRPDTPDDRVHVIRDTDTTGVGALKAAACDAATGTILVELDHDDLLTPGCLEAIHAALTAHPHASLAYSDWAQVNADRSPNYELWEGWTYTMQDGLLRAHAWPPYPHNVGHIWWAPNHVRAFNADAYREVGGYNPDLTILDDQDLMARLYVAGEFVHVPELLYLQRIHAGNTQRDPATNAHIQEQTVAFHREHIDALRDAWTGRGSTEY
jgi:glycosyltransferase involved in cell wall biosynthesis